METVYTLGIDISKKDFRAALTTDGINFFEQLVENNSSSICSYFKKMKKMFACPFTQLLVCIEHTGIYSAPLLAFLTKNKIKVCVEPALQIQKSQGMSRGKSDQVDAKRIALYAFKNRHSLRLWEPQREVIQKLQALLCQRERLVKIKAQLDVPLNESTGFADPSIYKAIRKNSMASQKAVAGDILKIEKQINEMIKSDPQLHSQHKWATSIPGVGTFTALNVIIATGEFKRITDTKKFACYAGVAPFEHSSGSSIRGKTRVSKMANMTIKKLLHLAAMSAIQHCEEIKGYYDRKLAEGKNRMSVINAVRNKLITRIFMCVKQQRAYQKNYQSALA
jgi:transposase